MIRFAHLADVHLGAWRDERMRRLPLEAFRKAVDEIIKEKLDLVLIAGDFFNNPLPGIDVMRFAAEQLQRLREARIPVYAIAGSHDMSETGKTMLDVYHHASLLTRVDPRGQPPDPSRQKIRLPLHETPQGILLAGMPGLRGGHDVQYYKALDHAAFIHALREKKGFFLFHTQLDTIPLPHADTPVTPSSLLPPGFAYYAGGHVHTRKQFTIHDQPAAYPGPLFPNSFDELESLQHGSYIRGMLDEQGVRVEYVKLIVKPVHTLTLTFQGEAGREATERILQELPPALPGMILLIRLEGIVQDLGIDWQRVHQEAVKRGAYTLLRNTLKLTTPELTVSTPSAHLSEEEALASILADTPLEEPYTRELVHALISILSQPSEEGERKAQYEARLERAFNETIQALRDELIQRELRKLQKNLQHGESHDA